MTFYKKEYLYGIDNFEQISKEDVDLYQNLVNGNKKNIFSILGTEKSNL